MIRVCPQRTILFYDLMSDQKDDLIFDQDDLDLRQRGRFDLEDDLLLIWNPI